MVHFNHEAGTVENAVAKGLPIFLHEIQIERLPEGVNALMRTKTDGTGVIVCSSKHWATIAERGYPGLPIKSNLVLVPGDPF